MGSNTQSTHPNGQGHPDHNNEQTHHGQKDDQTHASQDDGQNHAGQHYEQPYPGQVNGHNNTGDGHEGFYWIDPGYGTDFHYTGHYAYPHYPMNYPVHSHGPIYTTQTSPPMYAVQNSGPVYATQIPPPMYAVQTPGPNYAVQNPGPNYAVQYPGPNYAVQNPGPNYSGHGHGQYYPVHDHGQNYGGYVYPQNYPGQSYEQDRPGQNYGQSYPTQGYAQNYPDYNPNNPPFKQQEPSDASQVHTPEDDIVTHASQKHTPEDDIVTHASQIRTSKEDTLTPKQPPKELVPLWESHPTGYPTHMIGKKYIYPHPDPRNYGGVLVDDPKYVKKPSVPGDSSLVDVDSQDVLSSLTENILPTKNSLLKKPTGSSRPDKSKHMSLGSKKWNPNDPRLRYSELTDTSPECAAVGKYLARSKSNLPQPSHPLMNCDKFTLIIRYEGPFDKNGRQPGLIISQTEHFTLRLAHGYVPGERKVEIWRNGETLQLFGLIGVFSDESGWFLGDTELRHSSDGTYIGREQGKRLLQALEVKTVEQP